MSFKQWEQGDNFRRTASTRYRGKYAAMPVSEMPPSGPAARVLLAAASAHHDTSLEKQRK